MILPLALPYSLSGFNLLEAIFTIGIYLPIIFGFAGIILGIIGMKGQVRLYLVLFNAFGLIFYIVVTLAGIFGFKQP
jgi:hypothetical protein